MQQMRRRSTIAAFVLFISVVTLVSLYGWVTAVPASYQPVGTTIIVDEGEWSINALPLLEQVPPADDFTPVWPVERVYFADD